MKNSQWFRYSNVNVNNQPKYFNTKEKECLDCNETITTRDYEETLSKCYYCNSKNLGNETIKSNPNV
jgi:DNA-directed RNA polymerase subunit RPC12/RpoP